MKHKHVVRKGPMALIGAYLLPFAKAEGDKLNVVYLLSDNQSCSEKSCHGYETIKTLHI